MSQTQTVRTQLKNGMVLVITPRANPRVVEWFLSNKGEQ